MRGGVRQPRRNAVAGESGSDDNGGRVHEVDRTRKTLLPADRGPSEPALELAKKYGVEVKEVYWTPGGPYDLIGIAQGRDVWTLSSFALSLQSLGNLDVTWVVGYSPEQMRAVITDGG